MSLIFSRFMWIWVTTINFTISSQIGALQTIYSQNRR